MYRFCICLELVEKRVELVIRPKSIFFTKCRNVNDFMNLSGFSSGDSILTATLVEFDVVLFPISDD